MGTTPVKDRKVYKFDPGRYCKVTLVCTLKNVCKFIKPAYQESCMMFYMYIMYSTIKIYALKFMDWCLTHIVY